MTWKRKILPPIAFPAGDGSFSTFIVGVRVHQNGFVEMTGMIRMPYQNRPKRGGGIAVPYNALNFPNYDKVQGQRAEALKARTRQLLASGGR